MKILCIEPIGFQGHLNFNKYILQAIGKIGDITLIAPAKYLTECSLSNRISIPESLTNGQSRSKIGARVSQIRVINFILKKVCLDDYHAIIFLAYETISFCLRWPRNRNVYIFEHNNIENNHHNTIKRLFYRYLPASTRHFVFLPHIKEYIKQSAGRKAFHIPHPHYREDYYLEPDKHKACSVSKPSRRLVIFSPSSSTPRRFQKKLKFFVSTRTDKYYAICKDTVTRNAQAWESQPFFKDYEQVLSSCDLVFIAARFDYRVSGVAYEALSYGKLLVLFDTPFARALKSQYPSLVFLIQNIEDIAMIEFDPLLMRQDHGRFIRNHSIKAIKQALSTAIGTNALLTGKYQQRQKYRLKGSLLY
jgi:hypothetical protein